MNDVIAQLQEIAQDAKAWPFAEARALAARIEKIGAKDTVLFETGYGPSGLPHIGTFGEVARTTMIKNAFEKISDIPTHIHLCKILRRGIKATHVIIFILALYEI